MPRKLAKITRIFSKIENVKSQRVTYWPKRIGLVLPMQLSYNLG